MIEFLKRLANAALGILLFLAFAVVIPTLFIVGADKLGAVLFPVLERATIVVFTIVLLVVVPLSFIQAGRFGAAACLLISSYVFGFTLWVDALLVTKILWGTVAVVIGLFLAGIGIVPMAVLASLFHSAWPQLWDLVVLTAVTYGMRAYAFRVASKADIVDATAPSPAQVTFTKIFISLAFAAVAAMFGVVAVAIAKAVLPIFRLTEGTRFQVYFQDPLLYIGGPLYYGYIAFRMTISKNMSSHVLKAIALGLVAGIAAAIVAAWAIPFRSFQGPVRWILILAQFPAIPVVVGYTVYRVAAKEPRSPPHIANSNH